ncbi:uncharacterized protein N7473_012659 [Penicillium subrubescens]|uniref:uncharacterized protein n=1 Tax=Penicillium subrubescens TaxID=1316194 RepID=UPI0025453D9B|nr:uncharacterized protein N7473_012659 [Penicillium subrubescens]KAJ5875312.1 hypothetical protein N7473_012659 [Penicillium subrubescens]
MEPLKIHVNGESSITRLAEQGTLRLTVESEGPDLETVSKNVLTRSNSLSDLFKTLSPKTTTGTATSSAAVTKFASTFLRTRNYTPRDKDNKPLPKVYQASMSLSVIFRDITKLSEVVGQLVSYSNVEISAIDWSLSEETQKNLRSQMRKEAIADAVGKAGDYAGAVGREVYPVEIMDGGQTATTQHIAFWGVWCPDCVWADEIPRGRFVGGAAASSGPEPTEMLDLSPPDILVTSSVSVQFQSVPEK